MELGGIQRSGRPAVCLRVVVGIVAAIAVLASSAAVMARSGSSIASDTPGAKIGHEFVYKSAARLSSVTLSGTFNNWSMKADPMVPDSTGKTWRLKLKLAEGTYEYKFVLNNKTWMADPTAKSIGPYGNSVLVLGGATRKPVH
jgi:1,4-alpha-glucan branching enzyme